MKNGNLWEINEDLWIVIKEYLFHRHLWFINYPYLKVIKSIPQVLKSNYYPLLFVQSHSRYSDKFIKAYNVLIWNNNTTKLITYSKLEIDEDIETELFDNY